MLSGKKLILAIAVALLATGAAAQTDATHSVLATGRWYKIPVATAGVYKITTHEVSALAGVPCRQVVLYGTEGGMLPTTNADSPYNGLQSIASLVADINGNGVFDEEDYLLFYGEGPCIWRFNSTDQRFEYLMHAYANYNYYYLTPDGTTTDSHRLQTATTVESNRPDITAHTGVSLYHEDRINSHGGGQIWVADKFTPTLSSRSQTLPLPGAPVNGTIQARYALACVSSNYAQFEMNVGSQSRQHPFIVGTNYHIFLETFSAIHGNEVTFNFKFLPSESSAAGYLDFIELNALVPMAYNGGQMTVRNMQELGAGNVSRFVVSGNSEGLRAWDVTDPCQPVAHEISQLSSTNMAFAGPTDKARTFILFKDNDAVRPSDITTVENQDIRGAETPDFVIVTHSDFKEQAQRLAELHRTTDGLSTMVVTQEQVFNEFSSGQADPMAIRKMMRCLRNKSANGDTPRYLLLFGKGTYDNRDILNAHQRTVVTYQTPSSFDSEGSAFPSDDIYGYLGSTSVNAFDGTLTLGIGRLPAKSADEATHMVNKIEAYMHRHDLTNAGIRGDWRNYIALLADDADPSSPYDTSFASDSESLARLIKSLYPHFNIDRIYADSYVQQSGADGSYYPDVNNALQQRMNYGCLLLNYIGHGSSSYIGTERFMEFSDIEKYANTDRLAFFVTSTCTFGKFDQVNDVCGAEVFLLADAAGVGIVAASRPIHHVKQFNTNLCLYALDPENTIGDALCQAKNQTNVSHCIALMGDPALRLSIPRNKVVVTHINNMPVNPGVTDSVEVLSRVTVEGVIQDKEGNIMTDFDGIIYPIVFDREVKCRTLANDNDSTEVDFVQQKNVLYKGSETVTAGHFSYSFIIPRDVSYHYDYAKLSHYARTSDADATGQYGNIMFGGFNEDMVITEMYPTIELFISDTNFRNGGMTNETPTLYARLKDSIGINAAGSGLGHDITAMVDGNPYSTIVLNDFFEPDITDSRNGEIRYTLGKLDDGHHTLTLKCWNIFNFSSSATIEFYVANDRTPQIGLFQAAPNPASRRTTIRVEHNQPGAIQSASIDIYDIKGCLVRSVVPATCDCTLTYDWDFTAANGSLVPRGIYVARVAITTTDGQHLTQTAKIVRN